jgi:Uncharacterised conserved protein (DUF2371)
VSDPRADEVIINGRKRLKVQVGIACLLGVLVFIAGFLMAYLILFLDRHNDARYISQDNYAHQRENDQKLHDEEMAEWNRRFIAFEKTQDEMRGDIKTLLQLPRQVDNLERRIRYANSVDHPKESPGGAIADGPDQKTPQ